MQLWKQGDCLVACEHKYRFFLGFLPDCGFGLARVWILRDLPQPFAIFSFAHDQGEGSPRCDKGQGVNQRQHIMGKILDIKFIHQPLQMRQMFFPPHVSSQPSKYNPPMNAIYKQEGHEVQVPKMIYHGEMVVIQYLKMVL